MLAVLALDVPESSEVDADGAVRVLRRPVPADAVALLELVEELSEGDPTVLVVHPRHRTAEVLPMIRLARLALRTSRLVAVPTDLSPLASGVLVDLLAALADRLDLDGGRAVALVPELERQLVVVGWVRSVARLRRPEPSLRQHLSTWFTPRGFEVTVRPEGNVRRLRADSSAQPPARGGAVRAAVLSGTDRDRAWLTEVLASARVSRASLAGSHPYAKAWFGTARAAELVVFPAELDALADALADRLRVEACSWCGLPGPGGPCAFCGADRAEPEPLPAAPLLLAPDPSAPAGDDDPAGADDEPATEPWLALRPQVRPREPGRRARHAARSAAVEDQP